MVLRRIRSSLDQRYAVSAPPLTALKSTHAVYSVLAVVSIPLYCAPPLLYLLCYEMGRWLKG